MTFFDRLESTELQFTDLSGLDFRGSDLSGACFDETDLTGATFAQAKGAIFDELRDLREREATFIEATATQDLLDQAEGEIERLRDQIDLLTDERDEARAMLRQGE